MTSLKLGGVPEHFNLPWHLAMESGAIQIEWHDQPGGTGAMVAGLADGSLDVIIALTEGVVAAIDTGREAVIVGVYVSSPLQWGVHVGADRGFATEADLDGQRIAISRYGSGSHLMAYVQAAAHGWQIEPDQFVVVGGIDGAEAALPAGDADQFLWDRFMTQPLVDRGVFARVGVVPTPWRGLASNQRFRFGYLYLTNFALRSNRTAGRTTNRSTNCWLRSVGHRTSRTSIWKPSGSTSTRRELK